mmetsp:Transcript_6774/g.18916  ORF Transcript_6774/g.18916 Transcript_6774/m.18916 type:complete len:316 (+) Transcript_6774:717-1664(+)
MHARVAAARAEAAEVGRRPRARKVPVAAAERDRRTRPARAVEVLLVVAPATNPAAAAVALEAKSPLPRRTKIPQIVPANRRSRMQRRLIVPNHLPQSRRSGMTNLPITTGPADHLARANRWRRRRRTPTPNGCAPPPSRRRAATTASTSGAMRPTTSPAPAPSDAGTSAVRICRAMIGTKRRMVVMMIVSMTMRSDRATPKRKRRAATSASTGRSVAMTSARGCAGGTAASEVGSAVAAVGIARRRINLMMGPIRKSRLQKTRAMMEVRRTARDVTPTSRSSAGIPATSNHRVKMAIESAERLVGRDAATSISPS